MQLLGRFAAGFSAPNETELGMGWVAGHTEDFNYSLNTSKKHSYNPIGITPAARQGGRRIVYYIILYYIILYYIILYYIILCHII